jgi:hypothetical protein
MISRLVGSDRDCFRLTVQPEVSEALCDIQTGRRVECRNFLRDTARTTDYATVLLRLPGISNDLEVVRLL